MCIRDRVTLTQKDREGGKWEEDWREPFVSKAFPEGHSYGMEHHLVWPGWARKRPILVQRIFQSDQQNEAKAAAE